MRKPGSCKWRRTVQGVPDMIQFQWRCPKKIPGTPNHPSHFWDFSIETYGDLGMPAALDTGLPQHVGHCHCPRSWRLGGKGKITLSNESLKIPAKLRWKMLNPAVVPSCKFIQDSQLWCFDHLAMSPKGHLQTDACCNMLPSGKLT